MNMQFDEERLLQFKDMREIRWKYKCTICERRGVERLFTDKAFLREHKNSEHAY